MSVDSRQLPEGVEYRRAGPDDNPAIHDFLNAHAMNAGLAIRFDRRPDFFALPNAHSPDNETWLLLVDGSIRTLGSYVFRDGYVDEVDEPVFYLGDLRVGHDRKVAGLWRALLEERLARLHAETGARFGYCGIIRDNRLARNSVLLKRRTGRLCFEHLRGYANLSIVARKPWSRLPDTAIVVRRAGPADRDRLRRFMDEESRRQSFGVVFDEATWRRRLDTWPGLRLDEFRLAFDAAENLLGCLAPWDFSALKTIVIDRMPAGARALRFAYNALTQLSGKPRLGGSEGMILPDISLTHVFVRDRDPTVFAALLDDAYHDIAGRRRYATVSLCLYDDDPLWSAMRRYWYYPVAMDLYSVCLGQHRRQWLVAVDQIPGFEIYLV